MNSRRLIWIFMSILLGRQTSNSNAKYPGVAGGIWYSNPKYSSEGDPASGVGPPARSDHSRQLRNCRLTHTVREADPLAFA